VSPLQILKLLSIFTFLDYISIVRVGLHYFYLYLKFYRHSCIQRPRLPIKGHLRRIRKLLATFYRAYAETANWDLPVKIWPRHSLRRLRFPIRQMHFHKRETFGR